MPYETGEVTSRDGTIIGYRKLGDGPGMIAVHGGMQAAQNLMKLGQALADSFTVYLPDRRGRGRSGPPGDGYGLDAEAEDIGALARATGARFVFGLSSGAVAALHAALLVPEITRAALYEPPVSVNGSTPLGWVPRYEREIAAGQLASAAVTAAQGTQMTPPILRILPRFVVAGPLNAAVRLSDPDRAQARCGPVVRVLLWPLRAAARRGHRPDAVPDPDDVPLREIVPTMRYDARIVGETEGAVDRYAAVPARVLLLGGDQSPAYLKTSLDALAGLLPDARRVTLHGQGHLAPDNTGAPDLVARELRSFYPKGVQRS